MKAIFPFEGNVILSKKDVEKIQKAYNINSNNNFEENNCISKKGIFNYFKDNTFFIYDKTKFATIKELKSSLGIDNQNSKNTTDDEQLDDDDIMSNSFFTTLKLLN